MRFYKVHLGHVPSCSKTLWGHWKVRPSVRPRFHSERGWHQNPEGLKCGAQCCFEACAWQVLARITAFYTPLISHDHHPRDVERRTEHLSARLWVSSVWWMTDAGLPKMQSVQVAFLSASLLPPSPLTTYGVRAGSEVGFWTVAGALHVWAVCWFGLNCCVCMCVNSCGQQMLWTVRARGGSLRPGTLFWFGGVG